MAASAVRPGAAREPLATNSSGWSGARGCRAQTGAWLTYGLLFNHIWSVAGNGSRDHVSATFMQPFLTYTTQTFTTFGVNTETTYDWVHHQGTVPIN